jgi:hypothetical protein
MKTIKAVSDTQQLISPVVAGHIEVLSSLSEADFPNSDQVFSNRRAAEA